MSTTPTDKHKTYIKNEARLILRRLNQDQRFDFISELITGYCTECGNEVEEGKLCSCAYE